VRIVVSRVLIALGAGCLLFAAVYEAVGYPWKILFSDQEELNIDTMPDPTPPSLEYIDALLELAETPSPAAEPASATPGVRALPSDTSPSEETASPDAAEEQEQPANLPGEGDGFFNFDKPKPKPSQPPVVLLGALKIPKLNISINIVEGAEQRELLLGAGHVPSSPAIGKAGNVVVAGHRTTRAMHPFRHLDKMEAGDVVILKNDSHTYTYSTLEWFVVKDTENWVLGQVDGVEYCLTLITCHPVGSAKERIILRAELLSVDGAPVEEHYPPPPAPPEGGGQQSQEPEQPQTPELTSPPEPSPGEEAPDPAEPPQSPEQSPSGEPLSGTDPEASPIPEQNPGS
jgi:LPXTG-site transpeptidase (sortase) family protein